MSESEILNFIERVIPLVSGCKSLRECRPDIFVNGAEILDELYYENDERCKLIFNTILDADKNTFFEKRTHEEYRFTKNKLYKNVKEMPPPTIDKHVEHLIKRGFIFTQPKKESNKRRTYIINLFSIFNQMEKKAIENLLNDELYLTFLSESPSATENLLNNKLFMSALARHPEERKRFMAFIAKHYKILKTKSRK